MSQEQRVTPTRLPACDKGHGAKSWHECEDCGATGENGHDCGDDCCVCLYPEDNMRCDRCSGKGGWWRCYACAPITEEEYQ